MAEAMIVASRRNAAAEMTSLVNDLGFDVVTVTPASARRIAQAYERWGKGVHPAGLNFGDCFAYAVANEHSCPLLFVGDDFSKTDVLRAL
jgi:ribonuclease VapC